MSEQEENKRVRQGRFGRLGLKRRVKRWDWAEEKEDGRGEDGDGVGWAEEEKLLIFFLNLLSLFSRIILIF